MNEKTELIGILGLGFLGKALAALKLLKIPYEDLF